MLTGRPVVTPFPKRVSRFLAENNNPRAADHCKKDDEICYILEEESALIWLMTRGIVDRVVTSACPVVIAFTGYAIMPKCSELKLYGEVKLCVREDHLKMEMEIPCSSIIKFITACSYSNDTFEDIMKAQVSVFKASVTLNIQAFKIKKSVSISFRMTQVHKTAKDHMMMIRDYDWMMISKKLKDHIQVKLKPKSLKFTTSDSQDTDQ
ncbi:hypothetical protein Tco_0436407 [Tanacetum coccineum]